MTDDLHNRLERKVNDMEKIIKLHPAICAVGRNYQIMIVTECDALVSVRVGEKTYFSQSNGIKKSLAGVHCIIVDMETLDKYNLLDLYYSIVNNCSNKLLEVFNKYYVGIDTEHE